MVETGSFSEAARQNNLATSSVSRSITELENWVGAALFHRTTRKLNLTEAGRQFHIRSKEILLNLEETRLIAAELEDIPSGHLHLSLPASMEHHVVVAAAAFQAKWPKVSFNLTSTDRKVDLIAEGFDLAIRAGTLQDSSLRVRKFAQSKRRLCASPDYLKHAPPLTCPQQISDHDCLNLGRHHTPKTWHFSKGDEKIAVQASGSFSANSGNALVEAARQGRGLVLTGDWILGPLLQNGELVEVLTDYEIAPAHSDLYVVHPYQKFVPPKVRVFVEHLGKHFGGSYDWSLPPAKRFAHTAP